jgi:hypothetical protein
VTVKPFSSLFTVFLWLSWDGHTLAFFIKSLIICSRLLTSRFKWSFTWAIASSQFFTLTWLVKASLLFEGLEMLDQRALNYTLKSLWVFYKTSYESWRIPLELLRLEIVSLLCASYWSSLSFFYFSSFNNFLSSWLLSFSWISNFSYWWMS